MNPQAEQENDNVRVDVIANKATVDETDETFCGTQVTPLNPLISDETLGEKIRSLNKS